MEPLMSVDPTRKRDEELMSVDPGAPPALPSSQVAPVVAPPAAPQETETDSTSTVETSPHTTITSPHTTQVVASKETKAAAAELKAADQKARGATEAKMTAEARLESAAAEAEKNRLAEEKRNAEAEAKARRELMEKRDLQRAAADAAEAKADEEVKKAQSAAINWDSRSTPFKILQAFIRAGSVRDSYILHDADPGNNPVIRTMNAALDEEKEAKQKKFLASKEWRDALKTKNAATIKEAYEQGLAKIDLEVNSAAKNLLMSEKTDAVASKAAKNDPNGELFKANRDSALAVLDQRSAEARGRFAQHYDPTRSSGQSVTTTGGTTTTTLKKSVTKDAAAGKPASAETRSLLAGSSEYERLAARNKKLIEDNGGKPPLTGPDAQEFQTNDQAMAKILQEPLGKSDSDAKAAEELQAAPGFFGKIGAQIGVGNSVDNYTRALDTNAARLRQKAADVAKREGKPEVLTKTVEGYTFTSDDGGRTWK